MAQVHLDNNSNRKWIALAAGIAVAALAALWWSRGHEQDDSGRVTAASSVAAASSPSASAAVNIPAPMEAKTAAQIESETKVMVARQKEAAQVIEKQPVVKPVTGVITERPSYVSEMEWNMLKGAAQQSINPDKELTRLVNFLRFNKQLELWESLASSTDTAKRQTLADQLLEELPSRVTNGEMDLKEGQRIQAGLLKDVPGDAQARGKRAATEAKRLADAAAAASQSGK